MFCNQCEQTAKGTGCTISGVCGKKPEVAALQDLLLHAVKGLSLYANTGSKAGLVERKTDRLVLESLFSTVTNVDFDPIRLQELIRRCSKAMTELKEKLAQEGISADFTAPSAAFKPASDLAGLIKQGEKVGLPIDHEAPADIQSLQQTLLFGVKGLAAYADHAAILGEEDDKIYAFTYKVFTAFTDKNLTLDDWVAMVLECGEVNLLAMKLLYTANTSAYGQPIPTEVPLGHKQGNCILVSGHDLKDLAELLKQTAGKNICIYTHGEMLPAHGYPELKKYKHFYGHYGTAWQNQKKEFAAFPGSILMTTNCIQSPKESYMENIFTTGLVAWPGVKHLKSPDFSPLIKKALTLPGFDADEDKGKVMVGFGHDAVLQVAGKIVEAVKAGQIKHFFLVGGCDGAKSGRNYYTDFVTKAPSNTIILTLGCGKFRFFDQQLGDIDGIPRLLDVGQCNDSYSAVQIAVALSKAFECGVNDLPLSMIISWYEQKAVAVLLTLLHLGIKNIRLGPSLPAFITPNVLNVLVENFNIMPIGANAEEDLAAILT